MTQCEGNHRPDAEKEGRRGVEGRGSQGHGRCGEQLSTDTWSSASRLVFWDVPRCSGISVNTEICLEWLYSSAGSLLSARTLKLWLWLRNPGRRRAPRLACTPTLGLPVPIWAGREPACCVCVLGLPWRPPHWQGGRAEMNLAKTSTTSLSCYGEPHLKMSQKAIKKRALFLQFFFFFASEWFVLSNPFSSQNSFLWEEFRSFLLPFHSLSSFFFRNGTCFPRAAGSVPVSLLWLRPRAVEPAQPRRGQEEENVRMVCLGYGMQRVPL